MLSLKMLLESAFQDQVADSYRNDLSGFILKPEMFDQDALELGVIFERAFTESFSMALAKAMIKLAEDPHFYDDVDDYGKRANRLDRGNSATWTGHPGAGRYG